MDGVEAIQTFTSANGCKFSFGWLKTEERQSLLATVTTALELSGTASVAERLACLTALRLLSRDKLCCDEAAQADGLLTRLLACSGLAVFATTHGDSVTVQDGADCRVQVEALKCLCNLIYNSQHVQAFCGENHVANAIIQRSKTYYAREADYFIKLFDMRLLFLVTALRTETRKTVWFELKGLYHLRDLLHMLAASGGKGAGMDDATVDLSVEVLKALFNVTLCLSQPCQETEADRGDEEVDFQIRKLSRLLRQLLVIHTQSAVRRTELTSHVVNLMTNIPVTCYDEFVEPSSAALPQQDCASGAGDAKRAVAAEVLCGSSSDAIEAALRYLHQRLNDDSQSSLQSLIPVLTVLTSLARASPKARRHCRLEVLPYLKDEVKHLPHEGSSLRNRLCHLLTVPSTDVSGAVAEFLFVLCKENVSRLIKYTGFGNAAGLLVQRGLLTSSGTKQQHKKGSDADATSSSTSDDSETEEYRELEPDVNPVTGRWEPAPANGSMVDSMTEEQKEYEAMKLVDLMHQLTQQKLIRPATIGEDGQLIAVDHILELTAGQPSREEDDNSD